ncbi:MAG: PDZ domain-containing protein [Deltaproteobacteria bacterium]|nr:PDZ domain-containing protein [Deltaproteobacteria bacterium]
MVVTVEKGSPAYRAGLTKGDIIISFDDHIITEMDSLHRVLTEERVGKQALLTVIRGTDKLQLPIIPEESKRRDDKSNHLS